MKSIVAAAVAAAIGTAAFALDPTSYGFNERLLELSSPAAPEIFEDAVIFTASSSARRVGIAFAHEDFARVHWFKKLMKPVDDTAALLEDALKADAAAKKKPAKAPAAVDSGVLFYAYEIPRGMERLEYRLVIDGLWTADPWNPSRRIDPAGGAARSVVVLPVRPEAPVAPDLDAGALRFDYAGPRGEAVTVAGTFNGWDPFMYEMPEVAPGRYALTLPLPPGTYRYAFFVRGDRVLDPANPRKVYAADGKTASEAIVR